MKRTGKGKRGGSDTAVTAEYLYDSAEHVEAFTSDSAGGPMYRTFSPIAPKALSGADSERWRSFDADEPHSF